MRKLLTIAVGAAAMLASAAHASNLVVNGDFETTTAGIGQLNVVTNAPGWSTPIPGYNFIENGSTADSTGANGIYGNVSLWGPGHGVANGYVGSPTGGNFLAADGAFGYGTQPIMQTINGLVSGVQYVLSFDWAGSQLYGFDGATTSQWVVSLGSETHSTAVLANPSHGFTGWQNTSMTFTATGPSEVLSFLAQGAPDGLPPFSLLDGVSLSQAGAVPEPASWALMLCGFGLVGTALRRRQTAKLATA